jgi:ubiquinone/menaquinone biosynthesis C-methylase UbiE
MFGLPGSRPLKLSEVRQFLLDRIFSDCSKYFGVTDSVYIEQVADAWLNDETYSNHRYFDMYNVFGEDTVRKARILDMASGCGTFVFYGLLNGIDVWGIEPEEWKNQFNCLKADAYGYPAAWKRRFIKAVGEALPFKDGSFDFVSTYQTLEHVQDVEVCLKEMMRVSKKAVFVRAPDYTGTFEGHYRLPWLPLFLRPLARGYLKLLKRPTLGLETINYVTRGKLKRFLKRYRINVLVLDYEGLDWRSFSIRDKFGLLRFGHVGSFLSIVGACCYGAIVFFKRLFRAEKILQIVIIKRG